MSLTLSPIPAGPLLVGVSGGGDSVALLRLLVEHDYGDRLTVATFNHNWSGFGPQSVAFVRALCEERGLEFVTATGAGKPSTNAEAAARTERHEWLQQQANHINASILLAHTQTDIAESFLMRAGKGSGAGGLAALKAQSQMGGISYCRPLLHVTRQQLRNYLLSLGQNWLEDPDNETGGSQRARIRKLLPLLEDAGVTVHGLAASAHALADADSALTHTLDSIPLANPLLLEVLTGQPTETGLRLLLKLIQGVHPQQGLPVRRSKRLSLLVRLKTEPAGHATLSGVKFSWKNGLLTLQPE